MLFDKYFNAEGDKHREFCQIFGPEKIPETLGMFLDFFMVRKVMAGAEFKRAAGTVTKKLSKWLAEKGYLSKEVAEEAAQRGSDAARNLPRAEKAGTLIYEATSSHSLNLTEVEEDDYIDFDHHTITRIEPGKIWLDVYDTGGPQTFGPISIPKKATDLLEPGWEISCGLVRIRNKWKIVEMGNIYPL